jgi:hypothetical protein
MRERPARDRPARDAEPAQDYRRREPRGGVAEPGGSVVGFGAEIPAFMLIRRRGPAAPMEEPGEIEEADVMTDEADGTDIAA